MFFFFHKIISIKKVFVQFINFFNFDVANETFLTGFQSGKSKVLEILFSFFDATILTCPKIEIMWPSFLSFRQNLPKPEFSLNLYF